MKLKVAVAACAAALALPMAPAGAAEAIPGTCYEITITGSTVTRNSYDCECLVGIPWVTVGPPPPSITISYCIVNIPR